MVSPTAALKVLTSESPFMRIGSKIKSMFGNFFKEEEKANRSYEEARSLESYRAIDHDEGIGHRSKSIYHSVAPNGDGAADI
jgi:hypothetical protein